MDRLPLRRPPSDGGAPFFTRASVIGWTAACIVALVAYGYAGKSGLGALLISASVVAFIVAWIGGGVLAVRMGSLLALMVALLFPPFGSVLVALLAPPGVSGGSAR